MALKVLKSKASPSLWDTCRQMADEALAKLPFFSTQPIRTASTQQLTTPIVAQPFPKTRPNNSEADSQTSFPFVRYLQVAVLSAGVSYCCYHLRTVLLSVPNGLPTAPSSLETISNNLTCR